VFQPRLIDIWVDADPTLLPRPADATVDCARPVAASADVGRMSLPYASVDVGGPRPAVVAHPRSFDVASSRTRDRSDTPMPLSDVGQRLS